MLQVAKISFSALFFLSLAAFLSYLSLFPFGACACAWIGGVQICNWIAPRLPFARFIHWVRALTFEPFALLGVVLLRLVPNRSVAIGKGQPVLLIHGYMNHGSVWFFFKKRLEKLKIGPIYTLNLGHPFRSIRVYAENIGKEVQKIKESTQRKDLVLIGHSMGGLVAAYYATLLAPPNTVTDVVTIGSPLKGTRIACIGFGPNAREMLPNSPFLQEIRKLMNERKDIRFHHIATKSDHLVIPGISAALPENNHFVFEDLGHASLLYSPRVTSKIAEWLRLVGK